jgi:hypothetical protein
MNHDVHRKLKEIATARGVEYGKLVQKLLAIAFCEAGATQVTDRGVQGIDLEVTLADGRSTVLEVKTAQEGSVKFGVKDIDGLAARASRDVLPYFALLGARLVDEWIFARLPSSTEIRATREYSLTRLRAYRDPSLEDVVRATFPAAVLKHAVVAIEQGQGGLDEVLRDYACYRSA